MNKYSDEQVHLAARLYYVDGLGQAEVARLVKVSQATVSRLLAQAKERGIVRITVADYEPRHASLERALKERYRLRHAVVIKTLSGLSPDETRKIVARFAAPILEPLVPQGAVIALGGGYSLHELVKVLPPAKKDVTVVQAMGGVDSTPTQYDAHKLSQILAEKWEGKFLMFNAPALLPDKRTRDAFVALEQIRTVYEKLSVADVALVGVGTLRQSIFVERNIFGDKGFAELRKSGAVGEICGRYFTAEGRECETRFRDRLIGMELGMLKAIPEVIGVVVGEDRAEAVAAAIHGGLVKSLVVDESGAKALLA